jgi:glutathione S-transferase
MRVNSLLDEHKNESYLTINKAGTIPTLIVGQDKIISGGNTFPLYLAGSFKNVSERLVPSDNRQTIETVLNWFYHKMMPETQRLVRLVVPPKVSGNKIQASLSASEMNSKKEDQINNIFAQNGSLLDVLEKRLISTTFIASNDLSIADIIIYCELSTIMALLSKKYTDDIAKRFTKVSEWHDRMSELPHLKKYDEILKRIVAEYALQEKN